MIPLPCVRITAEEAEALCKASDVLCDPYENITWSISALIDPEETDETDVICFDHALLENGRIIVMSTINSESEHYIAMFACFLCTPSAVLETAQAIVDDAYDWFRARYEPEALESNTHEWLKALAKDLSTHIQ